VQHAHDLVLRRAEAAAAALPSDTKLGPSAARSGSFFLCGQGEFAFCMLTGALCFSALTRARVCVDVCDKARGINEGELLACCVSECVHGVAMQTTCRLFSSPKVLIALFVCIIPHNADCLLCALVRGWLFASGAPHFSMQIIVLNARGARCFHI
jgi:hypothetical protein